MDLHLQQNSRIYDSLANEIFCKPGKCEVQTNHQGNHWESESCRRHVVCVTYYVQHFGIEYSKLCYCHFAIMWYISMDSTGCRPLQWCHNERHGVSNHQPHVCLLSRLFGRTSKKTSQLLVTCVCVGNSPVTDEVPAQMASDVENVSIWGRHLGNDHLSDMKDN